MSKSYAKAGVNVELEHQLSEEAKKVCAETYGFSPFVEVVEFSENFRGPRGFRLKHPDPREVWLDGAPDGIGTKTIILDAAGSHVSAAADLLAMTGGDITRWGGLPLVLFNNLEVATLAAEDRGHVIEMHRSLLRGLRHYAAYQNVVCLRGDTAQMGQCVGSEIAHSVTRFNWSGVMIGAYMSDRMITGKAIGAGDNIIALREYGFRSNGGSAVRMALRKKFGKHWWRKDKARTFIFEAAQPAVLYDRLLVEANGWYDLLPNAEERVRVPMNAIVHVTGGGIPEKFGPLLVARGLSVELDDLWEPPTAIRACAEWLNMSDEECYRVWGCGQGGLVVVPQETHEQFLALASRHDIEARVCGRVVANREPGISIHSKFSSAQICYRAC
ncbi:MAG: AIR synthase-related protein [bacterium]|nr:AIR synthase-related protein [bacterium]MDZ4284725.1 AIR synthase-related protein [Patescibacteria group bacterium]